MKSLVVTTLLASSALLTACGPEDQKEPVGIDSDSVARVELQHEQDSIARVDSIAAHVKNDTFVPPMDSAELMQTMNILDSIKALKNK